MRYEGGTRGFWRCSVYRDGSGLGSSEEVPSTSVRLRSVRSSVCDQTRNKARLPLSPPPLAPPLSSDSQVPSASSLNDSTFHSFSLYAGFLCRFKLKNPASGAKGSAMMLCFSCSGESPSDVGAEPLVVLRLQTLRLLAEAHRTLPQHPMVLRTHRPPPGPLQGPGASL